MVIILSNKILGKKSANKFLPTEQSVLPGLNGSVIESPDSLQKFLSLTPTIKEFKRV